VHTASSARDATDQWRREAFGTHTVVGLVRSRLGGSLQAPAGHDFDVAGSSDRTLLPLCC
jgi:hypothetical protein